VDKVNRHKNNIIPPPRPFRNPKSRPGVDSHNIPRYALKRITTVNYKDIKEAYKINRQQELIEQKKPGYVPQTGTHPVNPHLIRAVQKAQREEELDRTMKRKPQKSARVVQGRRGPINRTLGQHWDDTPAETIGEWTPSYAPGSRGSGAGRATPRAVPMAGRVPRLMFTATEEYEDEEDDQPQRDSRPRKSTSGGQSRYSDMNTTTSAAQTTDMTGTGNIGQSAQRRSTGQMSGKDKYGLDIPTSTPTQARMEEALRVMEEEEVAGVVQRSSQRISNLSSQRTGRAKTPGLGGASASQLTRLIEEIDQAHPELLSKSPSVSDSAKARKESISKIPALPEDIRPAVEEAREERPDPPNIDVVVSEDQVEAVINASQPSDEIDNRTPSQDDQNRPVTRGTEHAAPVTDLSVSLEGPQKQLTGLEMTEQLLQLARTIPELPKSDTSAPSRRARMEKRLRRH
jgi:hypothetical protein